MVLQGYFKFKSRLPACFSNFEVKANFTLCHMDANLRNTRFLCFVEKSEVVVKKTKKKKTFVAVELV